MVQTSATLPNLLTALRIAAAPMLVLSVLSERTGTSPWIAVIILFFGIVTDLADGHLARITNQVSQLGVILDPIADKVLIVTALFLLCAEQTIHGPSLWPVLIILWRELLISGLREHEAIFPKGVSALAKWKTVVQSLATLCLFGARIPTSFSEALLGGGSILLWAAAALTLYTGVDYICQAWRNSWK